MAGLKIKKTDGVIEKESPNSLKVKVTTKETEKKEPEKKEEENEPVIDEKIKGEWNNYLNWLEKKGKRGKEELDKGDVGNVLFRQYIKENPSTSLSEKIIPGIRKEYMALRDSAMKDIKEGRISYKGAPETFMSHILKNEKSTNPNYVGQHLTQTFFPGAKIEKIENGKKVGEIVTPLYTPKSKDTLLKTQ
jgi:hypothetical protein